MPFLVDWMNEDTVAKQPLQLLPFQCYYEHNPSPFQFTVEIFLNQNMSVLVESISGTLLERLQLMKI